MKCLGYASLHENGLKAYNRKFASLKGSKTEKNTMQYLQRKTVTSLYQG